MRKLLLLLAVIPLASVFLASPASAADESPGINDHAWLAYGRVTPNGDIKATFILRCPRHDRWTASMTALTIGSGAPDDIVSFTNRVTPPHGTCTGRLQLVTLRLVTQPIDGTLYPAPRNCSAEYGVTFTGTGWQVAFDRGGADGGPDGPGPQLCLH